MEHKPDHSYHAAPLPESFMIMSMIGTIIFGTYTLFGRLDLSWGFAFTLTFLIMFISSLVSINPPENRKYWEKIKRN